MSGGAGQPRKAEALLGMEKLAMCSNNSSSGSSSGSTLGGFLRGRMRSAIFNGAESSSCFCCPGGSSGVGEFDVECIPVEDEATVARASVEAFAFSTRERSKTGLEKYEAILDSGANWHVCGDAEVFERITDVEKPLHVADRPLTKSAKVAFFRSNDHELIQGLYHPDVKVLLVSVSELQKRGARTAFEPRGKESTIEFAGGAVKKIRMTSDGGLPVVDVNFSVPGFVATALGRPARTRKEKEILLRHQRSGHLWTPEMRGIFCPQCAQAKSGGGTPGHAAERPEELKPLKFLSRVAFDYTGKWPRSIDGCVWSLNGVDDFTKWTESYPTASRDSSGELLETGWVQDVGKPECVRTDNGKEFKEEESSWARITRKLTIRTEYTAPYSPSQNGVAERGNRTISENTRANMAGVDSRLWSYGSRYTCYKKNRSPRRRGPSSYRLRYGRDAKTGHWRRFGCLMYSKVQTEGAGKLADRYESGVFLGYARRSGAWLVGVWRTDKRAKSGWKFHVLETRSAKFVESILVSNIDDLRGDSQKLVVTRPLPAALVDEEWDSEGVVEEGIRDLPCAPPSSSPRAAESLGSGVDVAELPKPEVAGSGGG